MCERRCIYQMCRYCRDRNRYESSRSTFLHRSNIQHIQRKHLREDSMVVLDDFIEGRLSLRDLELVLDAN